MYFYYSQKNESFLSQGIAEIRVNWQRSRVFAILAGFQRGAQNMYRMGAFINYVDKFLAFFDHLPTYYIDIFYLINVDKKSTFFDYLPTSSCKRITKQYKRSLISYSTILFTPFLKKVYTLRKFPQTSLLFLATSSYLFLFEQTRETEQKEKGIEKKS